MKKQIIYIGFLLSSLLSFDASAQCSCNIQLEYSGNCCYDVYVTFDPSCPNEVYDQIVINTLDNPSNPGFLFSANSSNPDITTTFNPPNEAIFTISENFVGLSALGEPILIGNICMEGSNNIAEVSAEFSGPANSCNTLSIVDILPQCFLFPPADFVKIYGDTIANRPTKIKAFMDGVYVVGVKNIMGLDYATISKFDISSGSPIWEHQINFPSVIQDFEYDPFSNRLLLVGRTEPFKDGNTNYDNQSLLYIVSAFDGGFITRKEYEQPGREHFQRIIRHQNPPTLNCPFYVVGTKNPTNNAPSGEDIVVLYNIDNSGGVCWIREYTPANNIEFEFHRGLFAKNDKIVMLGNDLPDNYGMIIEVNALDGSINNPYRAFDVLDLLDGAEYIQGSFGDVIIAGTDFANNEAIIMILDGDYQVKYGRRFPAIKAFDEIGLDMGGRIYAIGSAKASPNHIIVNRLIDTGSELQLDYSKRIVDSETDFKSGHFFVDPNLQKIFYADARLGNPSGFGDFDMLVASFDLNMNGNCVEDFAQGTEEYSTPIDFFTVNDNPIPEPPFDTTATFVDPEYACEDFCIPPLICATEFFWDFDCFTVFLFGQAIEGTPPFTYQWDIGCNGTVDFNIPDPVVPFPGKGIYEICLKMTDADGCMATYTETILLEDNTPPNITCSDMVVSTDPGQCTANLGMLVQVTDNCDPNPQTTCQPNGPFGVGITTLTCTAEDFCGNMSDPCTFQLTVQDNEPPIIICPSVAPIVKPLCPYGTIVDYDPPIFEDNCGVMEYVCDPPSGSTFQCGATAVTCTAIDSVGNSASCTFPVEIECQCGVIDSSFISCRAMPNTYDFTLYMTNLTNGFQCNVMTTAIQAGVNLTFVNTSSLGNFQYKIEGIIQNIQAPIPDLIELNINISCSCNGGPLVCNIPVILQTPCCDSVFIENSKVCKDANLVEINLGNCDDLLDIQEVRWYVADAPCPPLGDPAWGTPFQRKSSCILALEPFKHSADICVYAEVSQGSGPCGVLTSNVATITLCEPISCQLNNQEYCYVGTPITPSPLTLTILPNTPNCGIDSIQWFDINTILVGENGLSYQPPALSFTADSSACYQDYTYLALLFSECGNQSCTARIRLYNDNAPTGNLVMDPLEPMPFCPGEDASLWYSPKCAGEPPEWNWWIRNDGNPFTLTKNGNRSPKYNTNKLYQDTWYQVIKQNGTCQEDTLEMKIDVINATSIDTFIATALPACDPDHVDMQVEFSPQHSVTGDSCAHQIDWYRNSDLIHTSIHTSSPAQYTYLGPLVKGNYYAIVRDTCCPDKAVKSPVITIDPPVEAVIAGPCFRCNDEDVLLEAFLFNLPSGVACDYQWYKNNVPIPGSNSLAITVQDAGFFRFEAACNDNCIYIAEFNLLQCGGGIVCLCAELAGDVMEGYSILQADVYTIQFQPNQLTSCDQITWDWKDGSPMGTSNGNQSILHTFPSSGTFDVCMIVFRTDEQGDICDTISTCESITSTNDLKEMLDVRIYPNPTSEILTVEFEEPLAHNLNLRIVDIIGRTLQKQYLPKGVNRHQLDVANLAPAVYFIQLVDDDGKSWYSKFVKQ